jgi:DNA-binding GntR family transcriptional regulator
MTEGPTAAPTPEARAADSTIELERLSTVEVLAAALRKRILDGELSLGARLREADIASTYSVARTTVRATLQTLVHDGLAKHSSHRGVFVSTASADSVRDLYVVRLALETEAARRIVSERLPTGELVAALESLRNLRSEPAWSDLVEADLNVHRALVRAVRSPGMSSLFDSLLLQTRLSVAQIRHLRLYMHEDVFAQHEEFVLAVCGDDEEEAVSRVREHLNQALTNALNAMEHRRD